MAQPAGTEAMIRDLVRSGDQDRYWAALLAADRVRGDLLALYAFNIELARVPEQVREPRLGEIRLQWWRDALAAALGGEAADHPVLAAVAEAAWRHDLPAGVLDGMIDARSFDLADEPMKDLSALLAYLDATAGAMFRLGARITGGDDRAADLAGLAGIAYGLTGLMRALPYHIARGNVFLPGDLLAKHGLHPQAILNGGANDDLRAVLRDLREIAAEALANFRRQAAGRPGAALPVFLPLALVEPYLKRLASAGHDPLLEIVQLNPLQRYALIWRAHLRGRI
ncbi:MULTISPECIES: phytoene/squalene synthase family protein [Rhodomicrobium]|uniref:phytoene/squalene synthase family protein n=1 Tax=Rhodomicrobium TaxID=1068 RepID=UPI001483B982|nr:MULTISPECIES: phytoene/squalene synthase family protein [Rhodomicrobium]